MGSVLLFVQLAVGTTVVLAPGYLVARALGARGPSATVVWALVVVFGALCVTFLLQTGLWLTVLLLLATAAAVAPRSLRWPRPAPVHGLGAVALAGGVLGIMLWPIVGYVGGDGFFHLARVRKLVELGDLTPWRVGEFADASLHPGYAFPLWHGFLALIARVSFADPGDVVLHEATILVPIVAIVGFEAARLVFRRTVPAAIATAAGIAMIGMAPSHGGALTALALPLTASRQLLVPATLALALEAMRRPSRVTLAGAAAGSFVLAVVHPTYALFLWIPFAGFVGVRWLWDRRDAREGLRALAALVVPASLYFVVLLPVIRSTASVAPDAAERLRGWKQYAGQLSGTPDRFAVSPELFSRAGAVAVAALLLLPLAMLAARRRWAAFAVGGALAIFVVTLLPVLFTPFSDLVSLSQSRRLAGFVPFGIALAGGLGVLAALLGRAVAPVALGAGVLFQLAYPGDFGYTLEKGGPAWVTWLAVLGCVLALGFGLYGYPPLGARAGVAAVLLLAPTYVHGLTNWTTSPGRVRSPLSDGLVGALRDDVPDGATVYADPEASYRIGASAPLYVCVNPPGHVADTERNRPRERVDEFRRFARTGDLSIPRACGATWLVVDRSRFELAPELEVAYQDERWRLYRL
jgi:hypothetical protein